MTGQLDWKWIGIGVVIMIALNMVAGLIIAVTMGSALQGATDVGSVTLSGGQIFLISILNLLAFLIGGFIVGIKSAGRTVVEPGISAAIAVIIVLVISGSFSLINLIAGGLVPFVAGVVGGWYGERQQGTA
jgi:hypothetical protein